MRKSSAPSKRANPPAKRVKTSNVLKTRKKIPFQLLKSVKFGTGFPLRLTFTHKYSELGVLTSTSGVFTNYKFVTNGLFDPNSTGAGHQPYYFDQLATIYNHYTVTKSTINVRAMPTLTTNIPSYVALYVNDDTTSTPASIDNAVEALDGQIRLLNQGKNDNVNLVSSWDAQAYFGGSVLGNDNLQGTVAANPTETSIWNIGLIAADAATTVSIYFQVEIMYTAVWEELKDIASS